MKKLFLTLLLLLIPSLAFAQLTTNGGGTGLPNISTGSIPFGSVFNIRMATSSALQWNNASSRLTFTFGSTTALSATTLCLTGDICRTSWPTSGTSSFGTSSLSALYPILYTQSASLAQFSLDFGTTTSNTWAGTQTFTNLISGSINGNANTATALATGRTISITGDLAYTSPSFDGSSNVTAAGTLATVNSNVGSFTNANITVNGKGLITAASNGTAGGAFDPFTHGFFNGQAISATSTGLYLTGSPLSLIASSSLTGNATTTNATTTALAVSNLTSGNCVQVGAGGNLINSPNGSCGAATGLSAYNAFTNPTATSFATTSGMVINNASSTFVGNLLITGNSTTTNATTTSLFSTTAIFTNASTTNLIVSSAGGTPGCATFAANGLISNTGTACGTGGGSSFGNAFTFVQGTPNYLIPTTSPTGIISTASSTLGNGNQTGGLTVNGGATTTGFLAVQGLGTSTFVGGINLTGTDCFATQGTCLQTFIQNATAYKQAVSYATAAVLSGTPTYSNGTAGVGATLTEVGTGALTVDGQNPSAGQRVLIKNQADQTTNGIYTVTVAGSGIASYVLTRSTDYNTSNDIYAGTTVPVLVGGTANGDTQWTESTTGTIVVGTSNIVFIETSFGTSGTVTSIATNNGITGGTITTSGTIGLATINAGVLGAVVNGAIPTSQPTSTLFGGSSTGGFVLQWSNATNGLVLAATSSSGLTSYDAWTHPSAGVSATTSQIIISASSTIGNGNGTGGLTINGNATTTGNSTVSGNGTITGALTVTGSASFSAARASIGSTGYMDSNTNGPQIMHLGSNSLTTPQLLPNKADTSTGINANGLAAAGIGIVVNTNQVTSWTNNGMGIGTSTPQWALTISTSTRPQLTLTDGSLTSSPWNFRAFGTSFFLSTSSPTTFATSTNSVLTIDGTQPASLSIGSTTQTLASVNGLFTQGTNGANGSSTISTGKWQIDTYNSAGTRSCAFIVGTAWVIQSGACNP